MSGIIMRSPQAAHLPFFPAYSPSTSYRLPHRTQETEIFNWLSFHGRTTRQANGSHGEFVVKGILRETSDHLNSKGSCDSSRSHSPCHDPTVRYDCLFL